MRDQTIPAAFPMPSAGQIIGRTNPTITGRRVADKAAIAADRSGRACVAAGRHLTLPPPATTFRAPAREGTVRIRGILFDKDGTLLDFHATWMPLNHDVALFAAGGDEQLARKLLIHGGYDVASGRIGTGTPLAAGTPDEIAECFSEVLHGAARPDLAADIDRIFALGATVNAVPVPRAREAMERLRQRTSYLGVATHDSMAGIEATLGPHGLLPMFDFLAGHDSGHGKKPGPGMLEAFCRKTGLAAHEVAVIGDNSHDLLMGANGGAALKIGVLTGTSTRNDLALLADLVFDSIAEMSEDEGFMARLA
jgi:phosphoglycolate phosphatase